VAAAKKAADLAGNARLGAVLGGDATRLGRRVSTGRLIGPEDGADDIMRVYNNRPEVRRTFDRLAGMSGGEIATKLPRLAPLAQELGRAQTPEQVAGVFRELATVQEYSQATGTAEDRADPAHPAAANNRHLRRAREADRRRGGQRRRRRRAGARAEQARSASTTAVQSYRPIVLDPNTMRLSGKEFDPMNPQRIPRGRAADALLAVAAGGRRR
jgi:hypothetical protein